MEMLPSFVVNGGIKLPIGYRFCPTDEELIIHYLRKKAFAQPLPASVIPEFDVFQTHPWGLPGVGVGDSREKGYFFSNRKDYLDGNVSKIAAGSGYWKPTGKDKQIVVSQTNRVVGTRKTLIFWEGKRSCETKTRWVMHELSLAGSGTASYPFQMPWADWAVYRIFQKKKKLKRKGSDGQLSDIRKIQRLEGIKPSFIDFTLDDYGCDEGPPPPCSPSLSEGSDIIASNKLA